MTLIIIDSFGYYDRTEITATGARYENWNSDDASDMVISADYGRSGDAGLRLFTDSLTVSQKASLTKHLPGNYDEVIVGAAVRIDSENIASSIESTKNQNKIIFSFLDGFNAHVSLAVTPSMRLIVSNGEYGTQLARSSFTLHENIFYYIEFKCFISNTIGTFSVRVDGAEQLSGSGDTQNTENQFINGVRLGVTSFGGNPLAGRFIRYDDLYIAAVVPFTTYSNFMGDIRVEGLAVIGDGPTHAWTPSSGTNHYALVDDATPSSSDFVEGTAGGQVELFRVSPVTVPAGSILAVTPNMYARKDEVGVVRMSPVVDNGAGTQSIGGEIYLSKTWRYYHDQIWEKDPTMNNTQWSLNAISSDYFGIKRTG